MFSDFAQWRFRNAERNPRLRRSGFAALRLTTELSAASNGGDGR
jgi:hypothetical protein